MTLNLTTIDWTAVGSIATAITLAFSLYQIYDLKKQRQDDIRARLSFSFIAWQGLFLLKIANVGRECAYDIDIHFGGELYKNLYAQAVKNRFEKLGSRKFAIEAQRAIYFDISHVFTSNSSMTYNETNETFDSSFINNWLKNNFNEKLNITGSYCDGKYQIKEDLSLADYITGSIEFHDDITLELRTLNKTLAEIKKSIKQ